MGYPAIVGFFLLDHPNQIQQYRHPRRQPLSGVVVVHTAESIVDDIGIDYGAENVANFIAGRADYGSYHEIVDSDSTVQMAPDDHETWHVAADAHNWHSWGISAACAAHDWDPDRWWTRQAITRMGARIAEFWARNGFDVYAAARFGMRSEALARHPACYLHGVLQPGDRSDAWRDHPRREELENMLLDAIRGVRLEEDNMPSVEQVADAVADRVAPMITRIVNQAVDDGVRNLADNAQNNMRNSILQVRLDIEEVAVHAATNAAVAAIAAVAAADAVQRQEHPTG
jgi:hypothetical protein